METGAWLSAVRLLAESQPPDQIGVSPSVLGFEIVEKPPSLSNQFQQPAARVVIFCVDLTLLMRTLRSLRLGIACPDPVHR